MQPLHLRREREDGDVSDEEGFAKEEAEALIVMKQ